MESMQTFTFTIMDGVPYDNPKLDGGMWRCGVCMRGVICASVFGDDSHCPACNREVRVHRISEEQVDRLKASGVLR